jgi:hypothetical protein
MTQSIVTIEGLTKLANDLIIQNAGIRNRLDTAEKQRDELLGVLEDVSEFLNFAWNDIEMDEYSFNLLEDVICKAQQAIAKAKGE